MNDSLTSDARRFRLSLAASVFLNLGLLVLIDRLGGRPDLSSPQGRPHLRMVTLARHPAPPSSGRRGVETATKLTAATASPSARPPRPPSPEPVPRPRRKALRRPLMREAAGPPPALRIVTTTRPDAHALSVSARTVSNAVSFDPPVPIPDPTPPPAVLRPRLPLPVRLAGPPVRIAAVPAVSVTMPQPIPAAPTPVPDIPRPTTARQEASRGTDGGDAGLDVGPGAYTDRKAGGPFGIGDGLAAEGVTRHIVYVLDVSGSMKSRLGRAEDELREALRGLRPGETFNIIPFSGASELFDPDMAEAGPGSIQRASAFLASLEAGGGTDLEDAVVRALMLRDVNEVVILTDGVPTAGETDPEKLAEALSRFNLQRARISTIGLVGRNPDGTDGSFDAARLLQRIAHDSGGSSKLVSLGSASP